MQGDTVAHCDNSLSGYFVNFLTVTDLFSAWTENRALWCKPSGRVIEAMESIEGSLPFHLRGFKSDSGSEFMNYEVLAYFKENRPDVPVHSLALPAGLFHRQRIFGHAEPPVDLKI